MFSTQPYNLTSSLLTVRVVGLLVLPSLPFRSVPTRESMLHASVVCVCVYGGDGEGVCACVHVCTCVCQRGRECGNRCNTQQITQIYMYTHTPTTASNAKSGLTWLAWCSKSNTSGSCRTGCKMCFSPTIPFLPLALSPPHGCTFTSGPR